jgi:RNA polymerase subunit RPABC4/transcription elongation factor Spt4
MSEKDELWYVQLSLRTHVNNDLDVQTFCNQCGELILQEFKEKNCTKCQSESWNSTDISKEYRQMLIKLQQDHSFINQLKIKYKEIWNEKFPKYRIPDPRNVGRLVPSKSESDTQR